MKIEINENNVLQLEEVYNAILLKSWSNEKMYVCMRDSGFEIVYENKLIRLQNGEIDLGIDKEPNTSQVIIRHPLIIREGTATIKSSGKN
jgi:hypothetical protein